MSDAHARITNYTEWLMATVPDLIPRRGEKTLPGHALTLLGSFKNWAGIVAVRKTFTQLGFEVLAPCGEEIIEDHGGFPILDYDQSKTQSIEEASGRPLNSIERAIALERLFTLAIDVSDFVYVVGHQRSRRDDGAYYGITVAGEIGYSWAQAKPVFADRHLSTTLDSQEGYVDWPYHAATIPVLTPYELNTTLTETGRLPETIWSRR